MTLTYLITDDILSRLVEEHGYPNDFNRYNMLKKFCNSFGILCFISNGLQITYTNNHKDAKEATIKMALETFYPDEISLNIEENDSSFYFKLPYMGKKYTEKISQFIEFCITQSCLVSPVKIIKIDVNAKQEKITKHIVNLLFFPEKLK